MQFEDIDWATVDPRIARRASPLASPTAQVWLATDRNGEMALLLDEEGLRVARPFSSQRFPWRRARGMRARDRTLTLWLQASQPLDLTLPDAASCAELRTALVEHGVEESEHGTASGMPTGAEEASPPSDTKDQARSARELLVTLFCVGLALALAGGLIVGASWPGPATDSSGDDHNGVWFGLILGAIGQVLAFIAVVGWGVMLGLRASGVAVPKTESQT